MIQSMKHKSVVPALLLFILSIIFVATGCCATAAPRLEPNAGSGAPPDPREAIARRYAPFVYHETDRCGGRQDVITNIDFDGDLVGNNNWENFERRRLRPTVTFAVLETETHWFVAYHLFHPRDWNHFKLWLNDTHENDGENLAIVARKSDGRVVLLWTQAHYRGRVHANPGSGIGPASVGVSGPFLVVDDRGRPDERGTHAAVFVQAQGHGIYGTLDGCSHVRVLADGSWRFAGESGLLFRPARPGEAVLEPAQTTSGEAPYALESTVTKLWPLLRRGELSGDGKLLDGGWRYRDRRVDVLVPRFYDADRASGPLGSDRGISPFALDVCWKEGTLGALFFDPARRWAEVLAIEGPWSLRYVGDPFAGG